MIMHSRKKRLEFIIFCTEKRIRNVDKKQQNIRFKV